MNSSLYLAQSRRIVKILKALFRIKNPYTSYYAWDYSIKGYTLEVRYTNDWNHKRFVVRKNYSSESFETNSLKELVEYIRSL